MKIHKMLFNLSSEERIQERRSLEAHDTFGGAAVILLYIGRVVGWRTAVHASHKLAFH